MIAVSTREANRRFARILQLAAEGREVTITRRGKPVARLVPVGEPAAADGERQRREVIDWLCNGPVAGEAPAWTRDELYEHDGGRCG